MKAMTTRTVHTHTVHARQCRELPRFILLRTRKLHAGPGLIVVRHPVVASTTELAPVELNHGVEATAPSNASVKRCLG